MLRNIIWDLDGTLFDTYPAFARSFQAALNDYGKDAALDQIERLARESLGSCASNLAQEYQLGTDDLVQKFEEHYDSVKPDEQPPFSGVVAVCEYICTIGGKNVIVTHRRREGTRQLLAAHNMLQYFTGYLTADDGYPKKPDPASFAAILGLYDLNPNETLAVGDRDLDILAGRAVGLRTCRFGSGTAGVAADWTIDNFDELYRRLAALRPHPLGRAGVTRKDSRTK